MGATRFRDLRGRFPHAEVPSVWNCVCDHTSLRWGGQKPRTDFGTQGLASCGGRNDVVESYRGNECRSGGCTILGEGDNNGNRGCPPPPNEQERDLPGRTRNRSHTLNRSRYIGRPRNTPFSRGECVRASSLAPPPGKSSVDREVYEVWSVGVGVSVCWKPRTSRPLWGFGSEEHSMGPPRASSGRKVWAKGEG